MGFLTLLKWVRTSEANWEDLQFFFKDRKCLERPHRIKDKKIEKKNHNVEENHTNVDNYSRTQEF